MRWFPYWYQAGLPVVPVWHGAVKRLTAFSALRLTGANTIRNGAAQTGAKQSQL
jgi:hypothetical protein